MEMALQCVAVVDTIFEEVGEAEEAEQGRDREVKKHFID